MWAATWQLSMAERGRRPTGAGYTANLPAGIHGTIRIDSEVSHDRTAPSAPNRPAD